MSAIGTEPKSACILCKGPPIIKAMSLFRLTILGSGTMMPTQERHPSAYLLECGEQRLLLDAGHTTIARLVDRGVDLHSIQTVFLSHFHADHSADAFPLIHARWVDDMYHVRNGGALRMVGPVGLQERWKKWREIHWLEPNENYKIDFVEGPQGVTLGEAQVELFEVKHVPWFQSVGIKVTHEGKSLLYTGDIGSDHPWEDLVERCRDVDLLLIEAAGLKRTPNHFTVEQILALVEEAGVKRALVTHVRAVNLPEQRRQLEGQSKVQIVDDQSIFEL